MTPAPSQQKVSGKVVHCPYKCGDCGKEFETRDSCRHHVIHNLCNEPPGVVVAEEETPSTALTEGDDKASPVPKVGKISKEIKDGDSTKCGFCGKLYSTSKLMRRHQLRYCKLIGGGEEQAPKRDPTKCEFCGKVFAQPSTMRRHQREACPQAGKKGAAGEKQKKSGKVRKAQQDSEVETDESDEITGKEED